MTTRFVITPAVWADLEARGQTGPAGVDVVSAAQAEAADLVVCGDPPSHYPGEDVLTWCHDCRCAIVHRPHMPRAPIKVCQRCAARRLAGWDR
jgi:hypothetical protein